MVDEKQILKAAVHAFVINDNKLLMSIRSKNGEPYLWGVPGGHVDDIEVSSQALIREMKEEINLDINKGEFKLVFSMHRAGVNKPYFCTFFEVETNLANLKNNEPEKCDELKWFDLDELPENIVPYIKKAINAYLDGEIYLED
ncbi:MAG: hypothetical protein CFH44_01125 [Proteobacteria bacterium]|nr:MAG: hypothetical protein CFH44_01125 [Pseudomonadota bacterium]